MSDSSDEVDILVVDNGTSMCKAGFAGDKTCRSVGSNVAVPRNIPTSDVHVLGSVVSHDLIHPMERGIIVNWEAMEEVWQKVVYDGLGVQSEDYPVLMTESPLNPKCHVEKMAQVMFESFHVPAFGTAIPAVLSLIESGRMTGTVCDVGEGQTHVVHIKQGYILEDLVTRQDFGGRDITDYLQLLLSKSGYSFVTDTERTMIKKLKEEICFCASSSSPEFSSVEETLYRLSNGENVVLKDEIHRCTEAYFQPSLFMEGSKFKGLQNLILDSISHASLDVRPDLTQNIVFAGASTMQKGFSERLIQEFHRAVPNGQFKLIFVPERNKSAWMGGSILASLSSFHEGNYLATVSEYQEFGPSIMHRSKSSTRRSNCFGK